LPSYSAVPIWRVTPTWRPIGRHGRSLVQRFGAWQGEPWHLRQTDVLDGTFTRLAQCVGP
jgi:hypothetical protein